MTSGVPMSFCRELVRAGASGLELIVPMGGMNVNWLVAAGCVQRVPTAIVSFEGFGQAPAFRRAGDHGEIVIEDWSELTLLCAFHAAASGVPYMPTVRGSARTCPAAFPMGCGR